MNDALKEIVAEVIDKRLSVNTAVERAYHEGEDKATERAYNSWQRALDNRLYNKRHLIDALVLTTQKLSAEHSLMLRVLTMMRADFKAAQLELNLTGKALTPLDLAEYLEALKDVSP